MKLLLEIKDKDSIKISGWKIRNASRAVLFDTKGLVPLLFVSKHNYHKLPGGGVDKGETHSEALIREVKEEVGSRIKVVGEVGKIIEYRAKEKFKWRWNLKQTSYCYIGKIVSKGKPHFMEDEISEGFKLEWLPLAKAISTVKGDKPNNYEGTFIQKRDLTFLIRVKQMNKTRE